MNILAHTDGTDTAGRNRLADALVDIAFHGLIGLAMLLPYRSRVRAFGSLMTRVVGPLAGLNRRIDANLRLAIPDLTKSERHRICQGVKDNFGRSLIESYSYEDFAKHCKGISLSGPGWDALEAARASGRPSILFTGHFGNYAAIRMALEERGHTLGVLYRPFSNAYFERRHRVAQQKFGLQFPRGPSGMQALLRNIRAGNITAIVADQHVHDGACLSFFGLPAKTSTAVARLALKYDAPLVPAYAVRRDDGFHFDVILDPPVSPGTPEEMTQKLNDGLEIIVRKYPGQWLWTHRRWKALR